MAQSEEWTQDQSCGDSPYGAGEVRDEGVIRVDSCEEHFSGVFRRILREKERKGGSEREREEEKATYR